ncbi:MAG: DNA methyltransferase, partial [Rikenellaceae bacterium]
YGIELDEFAQETAILSLWLAEHQMNTHFSKEFHISVPALPLHASGHIVHGNACRLDWNVVCPHFAEDEVYIMGNPPYLGSKLQSEEQRDDMKIALDEIKEYKSLDYIAAWFYKGAKYIKDQRAKLAFVSTNSICQGEQVAMLWQHIYKMDATIFFAYTSFKWGNNAKYNAGVTCAIIGLSNNYKGSRRLYNADNYASVPNINPYLTSGNNIIVAKSTSIPFGYPKMCFGCMPYDNGNLILSSLERDDFINTYPNDADLVKQLIGSLEFIRGESRYCFWISNSDLPRANLNPYIRERINKTKEFRLYTCKDKAAGAELAERAHQFREFINTTDSIIVPRVSSERREYIPMGFMDAGTIISDSAFAIYDAQVWLFGILTSKMHLAWVKAVGGKLEERIRYSATLCYNTFPFPKINKDQQEEVERYAEEVLLTREDFPELTLAQLYDPEKMPQSLRDAHRSLDLAVERCYRSEPFTSDEERLEHLFRLYEKMTKK